MQLEDKVIFLTGSTTGIGAAMARLFVNEGARVPSSGPVAEIEQYPVIGRFPHHDSLKHE